MIRFSHWLAPLALLWTMPAAADETADLKRVEQLGKRLYEFDQAAWQGTDDFLAQARKAGSLNALRPRIAGWIVERTDDDLVVTFYDNNPIGAHAIYRARLDPDYRSVRSSTILPANADKTLSAEQLKLIAARKAALAAFVASNPHRCSSQPMNPVVLPPDAPGGPTLVYFLTAQEKGREFPMGGHHRVTVNPDGSIANIRPFARGCGSLSPNATGLPKKATPAAAMVSHLLDPIPTEIHVFVRLASKLPLYVAMQDRLWLIEARKGRPRISVVLKAAKK